MKLTSALTDDALLAELGVRMARRRLDLRLSQAELARQAGVSKSTVVRLEAGASVQLTSWLRLLRVLGLVEALEPLIPPDGPRPMDLLKLNRKARQRAPRKTSKKKSRWTWDDPA